MGGTTSHPKIPTPDDELLKRAKRREKFNHLWNDEYQDEETTRNDEIYGLCCFLAREQRGYSEGGDPEQIKRVARRSMLIREGSPNSLGDTVAEAIEWADSYWDRATPFSGQNRPRRCIPPRYDPEAFKKEEHRSKFTNERYEQYIESDNPVIWRDPPGTDVLLPPPHSGVDETGEERRE